MTAHATNTGVPFSAAMSGWVLPKRQRSVHRRALAARLAELRYARRRELQRARHAVGYLRVRGEQLSTEPDRVWLDYLANEVTRGVPYVARHRAEARRLLREIQTLASTLRLAGGGDE